MVRPELVAAIAALEQDGRIRPGWVVEAARPDDSPLHGQFTWDDTVAAEAYRLAQAGRLISRVRLQVRTTRLGLAAPHYVRDPEQMAGTRVSIPALRAEDPEKALAVILYEIVRAESFVARVWAVGAELGLRGAIADVRQALQVLRERADALRDSDGGSEAAAV